MSDANDLPLVNAISPTHNRPELVCRAVRSALNQTNKNFEIVVVVNGPASPSQNLFNKHRGRHARVCSPQISVQHVCSDMRLPLGRDLRHVSRCDRNLRIAGIDCPPSGFEDDLVAASGVVGRIQAVGPDVLLVCLGVPKQEYWIENNLAELPCKLVVGLGCTFDVLSGKIRRAPYWMQQNGHEWLYRLCSEPRRLWRRYLLGNSYLIWVVLSQVIIKILRGPQGFDSSELEERTGDFSTQKACSVVLEVKCAKQP